jgi:predicted  nucleic acid-binding Zn-ribbon protein
MHRQLDHQAERLEHLTDLISDLRRDLSETSHSVRTLDLDMVGLEDKVKAFTGRISVRKRKDRKEPEDDVEPLDLNQAIRDGTVTTWPS